MWSLVDRSILADVLKVFVMAVGVILGMLVLENMMDDLDDLLGFGVSAMDIVRYYLVKLPAFLPSILPLAVLTSVLFSLGGRHRNGEVTAMRAAGMNLWRITRTLWVGGVLLSVGLFFLNAEWVPWSVEESRRLRDDYRFRAELADGRDEREVGLVYNLSSFNEKEGRLWFINRFNEYTYRAFGITVSELGGDRREVSRIVANEGFFDDIRGYWVFLDGRELKFSEETGEVVRSLAFARREAEGFGEEPSLMRFLEKKPDKLSLRELRRLLASAEVEESPHLRPYLVQYHQVLASPLTCFFAVAFAIPFAVGGIRVHPMVGVSKAILLYAGYFLLVSLSRLMGSQGNLDPAVAAWAPNGIILLLLPLFYKRFN